MAQTLDLEDLRTQLQGHYWRRREKTLCPFANGRYLRILDGHEFAASFRRSCPECTLRRVRRGKEQRVQYCHRYVLAYLVGRHGRVVLDLEMQQAHEGEIAAARRLVQRLLRAGPRAFDELGGDALCRDPKLCREVVAAGKDFIAVFKNKNRGRIQDFNGLRDRVAVKRIEHYGHTCVCPRHRGIHVLDPVRPPSASSEETRLVRDPKTRKKVPLTTTWMWATTLSAAHMSTTPACAPGPPALGHQKPCVQPTRQEWPADPAYHHQAHAMTAILLILMLAYNLFHVWHARDLKPALRDRYAVQFFAGFLKSDFYAGLRIAIDPVPH